MTGNRRIHNLLSDRIADRNTDKMPLIILDGQGRE